MRPLNKVSPRWSPNFAYAIGLIVTDGSLSKDGRHISFTSKDLELAEKLSKSLELRNIKIGKKSRGGSAEKIYNTVQFGDVVFYRFLLSIGIKPNKTTTIGRLKIPSNYFFDFLRGHLDGDGTFYSYFDPRWKSSFMFYTVFISASQKHIHWLQKSISKLAKITGHITKSKNSSVYQLKYAKKDSLKLIPRLYYDKNVMCLSRKRDKIFSTIH